MIKQKTNKIAGEFVKWKTKSENLFIIVCNSGRKGEQKTLEVIKLEA